MANGLAGQRLSGKAEFSPVRGGIVKLGRQPRITMMRCHPSHVFCSQAARPCIAMQGLAACEQVISLAALCLGADAPSFTRSSRWDFLDSLSACLLPLQRAVIRAGSEATRGSCRRRQGRQQDGPQHPREVFKHLRLTMALENPLQPQSPPDHADRVGERHLGLAPIAHRPLRRLFHRQLGVQQPTTENKPNRHGAARKTVFRVRPRVVSRPRYARIS